MNTQQMDRMRNGKGFVAALDQSGGSTPRALEGYGWLLYTSDAAADKAPCGPVGGGHT